MNAALLITNVGRSLAILQQLISFPNLSLSSFPLNQCPSQIIHALSSQTRISTLFRHALSSSILGTCGLHLPFHSVRCMTLEIHIRRAIPTPPLQRMNARRQEPTYSRTFISKACSIGDAVPVSYLYSSYSSILFVDCCTIDNVHCNGSAPGLGRAWIEFKVYTYSSISEA